MKFDRTKFFDAYKRNFPLVQLQVGGLERLLWGYENYYGWWDNVSQIANSAAQIKLETAHSFHPVVEGYYLGDKTAPDYYIGNTDRVRSFQSHLRYFPHFGRGDIQLTWAENYKLMDGLVRKYFSEIVAEFEVRTGKAFDLVKHPEQALDGKISFCVMTIGMHKGTFRQGHTLDRYINADGTDHFNARDIVNGDKNYRNQQGEKIGDVIALDAHKFENILNASLTDDVDADQILDMGNPAAPDTYPAVGPQILSQPENASPQLSAPEPAVGLTSEGPPPTPEPVGDAPDAPPSAWFNVEDWKPKIIRWLKGIWGGNLLTNAGQMIGNATAAIKDPEHWYIYAGIAAGAIILLVGAGMLISLPLLVFWLWNRREILHLKAAQFAAMADPNMKNVGLIFEKK